MDACPLFKLVKKRMLISTSFYTAVIGLYSGGGQMKKIRFMRYLTYFTIIFIIFILLQGAVLAAKFPAEAHENQKKSLQEGSDNQSRVSDYKQERQKIRAELELQREEYRIARKDFQKVKNEINSEKLNPNSDEALNATRTYLNSSIDYMIAHLSDVRNNIENSNGNGTEIIVTTLDEKIKLLETEKAEVANASSQKELAAAVRSVRGTWNDAEKTSLSGAGQIVSGKVGEFLNKSEALSAVLDKRIQDLNATGTDVSDLRIKLSSYKSYLKSAQEKKKDADTIYANESATRKDLVEANNYLAQSIIDINKANKLLRDIFEEIKNRPEEV